MHRFPPFAAVLVLLSAPCFAQDESEDCLVFRDGHRLRGRIVEITNDQVRIAVLVGRQIPAETLFDREDIVHIRHEGEWNEAPPASLLAQWQAEEAAAAEWDDGESVAYMIPLNGDVRTCLTSTPLDRLMADALEHRADVIVVTIDMDDGRALLRGFNEEAAAFYDDFFTVVGAVPRLTDDVLLSPAWEVKPRLVFLVRRAIGASAFLPLASKDIWFAPDGLLGGSGPLDLLPPPKGRSLRLGIAEGIAGRGGHHPLVVRGMSRSNFTVTFSMVQGKPVFHDDLSGHFLLTDAGQGNEADTQEDVAAGRVNDILWMNAEVAERIGVSRGTAVVVADVLRQAGIEDARIIENEAEVILDRWRLELAAVEAEAAEIVARISRIAIEGGYFARTRARGRQIGLLHELKSTYAPYAQAIDLRRLPAWPAGWDDDIDSVIQKIKSDQARDEPDRQEAP